MSIDTDDPALHAALLTQSAMSFGRIHWFLLHALERFEEQLWDLKPVSTTGRLTITSPKLSAFGHIAGLDPIQWWISQGEGNLPELERRTRGAYEAAQLLLKAAEGLLDMSALPDSYAGIVERLGAKDPRTRVRKEISR